VFVDVEEEFDWSGPVARAHRSTTAMRAFPSAHRRFAERAVPLTCMIDYPIADDAASVQILQDVLADGRSVIGAQLHPWVNPPHQEAVNGFNSFSGNLPRALQAAKIMALRDAIAAAFGTPPLIFRAGRYGLGPDTLSLLVEAGFRADSSVRACYDYSRQGGPDYAAAGNHAWQAGELIELPLTTVFTGRLRGRGAGLYRAVGPMPAAHGLLARTGLLQRIALTPEGIPIAEALEAVEVALGEGLRLLTFSFHSPSLAPGHTPYVRDAADLWTFWRWWDLMLDRLERRNVRAASLAEILAAAR
jgi:hypothetical protein